MERQNNIDHVNQKREKEEERAKRRMLLERILEPDARERLTTLALVKEERAKMTEDYIIEMFKRNPNMGRISSDILVKILENISEMTNRNVSKDIIIDRKPRDDDLDLTEFGI